MIINIQLFFHTDQSLAEASRWLTGLHSSCTLYIVTCTLQGNNHQGLFLKDLSYSPNFIIIYGFPDFLFGDITGQLLTHWSPLRCSTLKSYSLKTIVQTLLVAHSLLESWAEDFETSCKQIYLEFLRRLHHCNSQLTYLFGFGFTIMVNGTKKIILVDFL